MALHRGNRGPAVKDLQQALIDLGYALPRWGADGVLGVESLDAASKVLSDHGRPVDPDPSTIDDQELAFIYSLRNTQKPVAPPMIDRRAYASKDKDIGPRDWTQVTGWCLHQTACHLGASSRVERCDNVGAHFVVYQDGRIFWLHDLNRRVIHGNGWNNQTIGIEIDGLFAGIEGDPSTAWDDPSTAGKPKVQTLTTVQADAVRKLVRWGTAEVVRHGGRVTKMVAHRQSSGTRRTDPGSKVWKEIALPLSAELGFDSGGVGFKIGQGMPIPEAWDPAAKGIKY